MTILEKRIIELSYKNQLTHISSCLNCVNLIDYIYDERKDDEPFVMGNCHASLAHYVVLEKHGKCDAQEMIDKHGTHASRDMDHGIWCSGGSLGQPETIAVGMALANPERKVWLVTSDGSCMEGATMEAIRVGRYLDNLLMYIVWNGYGAYSEIKRDELPEGPDVYEVDEKRYPEWLRGLPGHYMKLSEQQFNELMR